MTEVKMPLLLDSSLNEERMLHPSKGTLKLTMDGVSEATLVLEDKSEGIGMHRWVQIYNQFGFVGIFRRSSKNQNIGTNNNYTLRHGIDILQDSIWDDEEEFDGTREEFLEEILDRQTQLIRGVKPWVLDRCDDTRDIKKKIDHDNLLDLFQELAEEGGDYYFTYNQNTWPWRVSLVEKSAEIESEFRLNRNIEKCQIKDNDAELCTRLILNINHMETDENLEEKTDIEVEQNVSIYRTYNNLAAQARYGIITKTADIDTGDSLPDGPFQEADAWAEDFLARRADPMLQIEIDGEVLKGLTGDDWDESRIGTQVRVALPDYDTAIAERCVTITYPELYARPNRVTVSLANALPTFTRSMARTQKTVAKNARGGRGSARKEESFEKHFQITDDAGNVLRQAGLKLDANGLLVYADDNVNMVGSRFNVQADQIGMVVGTRDGINFIKAGEIALAINTTTGQSTALINADHINISATQDVHVLAGDIEHDADGKLVIKNAGGLYVQRTQSGTSAKFGVWDDGNLTGLIVSNLVNGDATATINASKIYLLGETIADTITAQYIASKIATVSLINVNALSVTGAAEVGGNIYARDFQFGESEGGAVSVSNAFNRAQITTSGNTYTLQMARFGQDWETIGNFSRATTLGQTIGSNQIVVTASPQGNTVTYGIMGGNPGITWSGNVASVPVKVNIDGGETAYDTGQRITVDATSIYQAGETAGRNAGYIEGYNDNDSAQVDKSSQTLGYGQSVTVNAQYYDYDGILHNSGSSCTITAPADRYITGYNANTTATLDSTSAITLGYGDSVTVYARQANYDGQYFNTGPSRTITAPGNNWQAGYDAGYRDGGNDWTPDSLQFESDGKFWCYNMYGNDIAAFNGSSVPGIEISCYQFYEGRSAEGTNAGNTHLSRITGDYGYIIFKISCAGKYKTFYSRVVS